jgi:hypothetical protein
MNEKKGAGKTLVLKFLKNKNLNAKFTPTNQTTKMNADTATQRSPNQLITNLPPPVTAIAKKKILAVAKPQHKLFLELCQRHGFVGFSFARIDTVNHPKKGMKKNPIGLVKRAKGQITAENFSTHFVKPEHKAFAIMTGQISGVTVIDCDSKESYEKITADFRELTDCFTVKTFKGFHIYVKYNADVIGNTNSFKSYPSVDIRNDDGIVFAPPTAYINCNTKDIVKYEVVNKQHPFKEFPKGLLSDLKSKKPAAPATVTNSPIATPAKPAKPAEDVPVDVEDELIFLIDEIKEKEKEIRELVLNQLDVKYSKDRTEWVKIGAIIHQELGDTKEARDLFLQFSRRSEAFKNIDWTEIAPVWESFQKNATKHRANGPLTIGTLKYLCKLSAPFDFNLITTTNIANYFVSKFGDDFIQSEALTPSGDKRNLLVWWDGNIWNSKEAPRKMLKIIGGELFYDLQALAIKTIQDDESRKKALKMLVRLQDRYFKEQIVKDILTYMKVDSMEFDIGRDQDDNLQFKNGVLMLNRVTLDPNGKPNVSQAFRPRNRSDFVTKTLDWPFEIKVDEESFLAVTEIFRQVQPDPEQQNFQLGYLAYALTGHTDQQKFKVNIGYSAQNGKTFECDAHANVFGLYSAKLQKTVFNLGNPKAHKFLVGLLCSPIRYAYIEELDQTKLDADLLKDFVSGGKITVEVMYETQVEGRLQAKLGTNSNKDFNIDSDKGVIRRGTLQNYESKFLSNPDPTAFPPQFKKVDGLEKRFLQLNYRRAYLELLLPHVVKYYQHGLIVPNFAVQNFANVAEEYDLFKTTLFEIYRLGSPEDRVYKGDMVLEIQNRLGRGWQWTKILPELKRLGLVYHCQERTIPRNGQTSSKGVVLGLQMIENAID